LRPLKEINYHAAGPNGATPDGTPVQDENGNFPTEHCLIRKKPISSPGRAG